MTTYIGVRNTGTYTTGDRSWLWGEHGTEPGANPSITLDIAAFTAGTHYPDGFIPSGTAVGRITASGLYGPYDNAATGTGRETAAGLLIADVIVPDGADKVGTGLFVHGMVNPSKLPFAIDAAGITDLRLIHFLDDDA